MKVALANLIACSAAIAIAGCTGGKEPQQSARIDRDALAEREWEIHRPAPVTASVSERPLQPPAEPTLVKHGTPPLVWLVETDSLVSVTNLTQNLRLARAPVTGRTIVRVDPRKGVCFGDRVLVRGPLPADQSYGIYIEPDQPGSIRSETIAPSPPRSDEGNK